MKPILSSAFLCLIVLVPIRGQSADKCEKYLAELEKAGMPVRLRKARFPGEKECQRVEQIIFFIPGSIPIAQFSSLLNRLSLFKNPENIDLKFQSLELKEMSCLGKHSQRLNTFRSLKIHMSNSPNDEGMKSISKLTNLTLFSAGSLGKMKITAAGVEILSKSKRLKVLVLANTNLSDEDFISLKSLRNLEHIDLMASRNITGKSLSYFKKSPVKKLILIATNVNDEGLIYLKDLNQLEWLELGECPIKGPGLKHLSSLKNLSRLALNVSLIQKESLAHLQQLPKLEKLFLYDCDISDTAIPYLKKLKGLKMLMIIKTKITEKGLAELKQALPETTIEY